MSALIPSSVMFLHLMSKGSPQLQVGPQLQRRAARKTAVTTQEREVASSPLPLVEPQKLRRKQPQLQQTATAALQGRPRPKVCSWRHSCIDRVLSAVFQSKCHAQQQLLGS